MEDGIVLARLRDEASNLRILIAQHDAATARAGNASDIQPVAPRVDVEAMRKRLAALEREIHERSDVGARSDDPKAELIALEKERAKLTDRMHQAEEEWAEKVRTEGEASAAERSELHDIRNRLQVIQSRTYRLQRQIGDKK